MTFVLAGAVIGFCPCLVARTLGPSDSRGRLDRFEDLQIAGAATEIAGQRLLDARPRRVRLAIQQRLGGHENSRRAVAALRGAKVGEALLQRVQLPVLDEPLHGDDPPVLALRGQRQARQHRLVVDEDGAGAALAELAAVLGAGEPQVLAQHLEQRLVVVDERVDGFAVDVHRQPQLPRFRAIGHGFRLLEQGRTRWCVRHGRRMSGRPA
jgi:hypothetical protein